jgi:hypothetical protein
VIAAVARSAAHALELALDTERDAANEVEAQRGNRRARGLLHVDRDAAARALGDLATMLPDDAKLEVLEMAEAVRDGFARERWTLRLLRLAAEATERATLPPETSHG